MESTQGRINTLANTPLPNKDSFKHDPLDFTKKSIRLLRILPVLSANKLIQCEISHSTIDASYECLSYRWGDPSPEHEIFVDGKPFLVRQNLFDFLELIRSRSATPSDATPLIWIDSLCIDQSDIRERNHQVSQMGAIYRNATSVKIWLGKCPLLLKMLSVPGPPRLYHSSDHVRLIQTNGQKSPLLHWIYFTYGKPEPDHRNLRRKSQQVLEEEFFDNEYWKRAWITQEVYVAKHAFVMLENEEFSIDTCLHVLWGCDKFAIHNNNIVKKFALFLGFDNSGLPVIKPGGTSDSFLALLRQFSDKHCTVPRDRLYSLLSLYRYGDKVIVDYAQPDDELLCEVVDCLNEPIALCSVVDIARSLMPPSKPLGRGFIEFDVFGLALEWGQIETSTVESSMPQVKTLHNCRKLVAVKLSRSTAAETPCVSLPKILEELQGKATLVETQATTPEIPHFTDYGELIATIIPSEPHEDFRGIMPTSDEFDGPCTLRMYAHDFSVTIANKEFDLWTLRINLNLLWPLFGRANPIEVCRGLHRFSYDNICKGVRLGITN